MKKYIGLLFLLWTGVIILAYYIVQKPDLFKAFTGLIDTLWTLFVAAILVFNAYGIGKRMQYVFKFDTQDSIDHLLFGLGIGLGSLGLLGLLFSAIQLAHENVLTAFQIALAVFFLLRNDAKDLRAELSTLASSLHVSFSQFGLPAKLALILLPSFAFLLTLTPPFEAFDALFYHLTQPARILQDGGLHTIDIAPHFWFPNLTENVYLWALAMHAERATQMIHLAWGLLAMLLLWHWTSKTWNAEISRKTLLLLAAMPSLPMLASWAYADMALIYYSVAAIYAFTQYRMTQKHQWLVAIALMSGFAMSVKYTSFVVPLACGLLLLFNHSFIKSISVAAQFSTIAVLTALPYYARNAILMHNPFYPFAFGGNYWDSFRAAWYAGSGSGIGWNAVQLFLLPLNTVLGHRDANFFDGRMGPLFLILAPFTVWILISRARRDSAEGRTLFTIGVFSLISFAAWTVGVINSSALWQGRLLFPALIPFAIPTALAWDSLKQFDTSKVRISSLANLVIGLVIVLTVIDTGIFTLQRNPLAIAVGAQSRARYIERINPSYYQLMTLMEELPANAIVYNLFEPRTYSLPRRTQPDPIIDNFAHDLYLYKTPDAIIQHWRSKQYKYIVVYERGLDFMMEEGSRQFTPAIQNTFAATIEELTLVGQTTDKVYSIYQIP